MLGARDIPPAKMGAEVAGDGVNFRVWAPDHPAIEIAIEGGGGARRLPLHQEGQGYWSVLDREGRAGDLYRFQLGDGVYLPDVASRFQPRGVFGPSECIDPRAYVWKCGSWLRPAWKGQTIYELHIGAMTRAGSFRAAISKLARVREMGAEAIEIMPLADFAGRRNWGYDGVALYAPARCYGRPDDLRALVDAAHACGLAVILDVVYNHVGPQGSVLHRYCADYFRSDRDTPWGRGFNLDGDRSGPVREFLTSNAAYWLDEFRFDGIRLDATHAIRDSSPRHLLEEIADLAHARGGFVIAEDDRNYAALLRPGDGGGLGIDAAWADDFHHQIRVALTGTQKSYFSGYKGTPAAIADTLGHGWTYRGQPYPPWAGRPRGSPSDDLPTLAFVCCIENHDQIGNRAFGERLEHLVNPALFRAASMLLCLGPYPALIFMGQEWAASTPFLFFCDHGGELGRAITESRRREFGGAEAAGDTRPIPDPEAVSSFENSKLRWKERGRGLHAATLQLYRECLRERREVLPDPARERGRWSVHSAGSFVAIRYRLGRGERMLLLTLQEESLPRSALPESLGAAPGEAWRVVLDSESARFGGQKAEQYPAEWTLIGPGALWLERIKKGAIDATA